MKSHVRKPGRRLWIVSVILGLIFLYRTEEARAFISVAKEMIVTGEKDVYRKIALTFDDGPHPIYTPELLEGDRKSVV